MLNYTGEKLGTLTIKRGDKKYKIQIRRGNCLAAFIYIYKMKNPSDPERPWVHQLYTFFNDDDHVKNIMKEFKNDLFGDEVIKVELNLYYKESTRLAKYMAMCGYKTEVYYNDEKKEKK